MMYTVPVPEELFNRDVRDRIGEAVYLLGHLIQKCDWRTGRLVTTARWIEEQTGFPAPTVRRYLRILRGAGMISTRRLRAGTEVIINGYEPIARTRGVKFRERGLPNGSNVISGVASQESEMIHSRATSGASNSPGATHEVIKSDRCNVFKFMYKTIENDVQNSLPFLSSSTGTPESIVSRRPDDPEFDDWKRLARVGEKTLAELDEAARRELEQRALGEMAGQRKWSAFVRRNEQGELEPAHRPGPFLMRRMVGEIVEKEEGSD